MNERIRKIRKSSNLSQKDFGERLGASRDTIANLESGRVDPGETIARLICKEFSVSQNWLRDGTGEMFVPPTANILDNDFKIDNLEKAIIEQYLNLSDENRAAIKAVMWGIVDAMPKKDKDSIQQELDSYRSELEAEKKGIQTWSASQDTKEA